MVTLDGKLYEKSSAITQAVTLKKSTHSASGQNDDKELERAKKQN